MAADNVIGQAPCPKSNCGALVNYQVNKNGGVYLKCSGQLVAQACQVEMRFGPRESAELKAGFSSPKITHEPQLESIEHDGSTEPSVDDNTGDESGSDDDDWWDK